MSKGQDSKKGSKKEPAKTMNEKKRLKETKKMKRRTMESSINNIVEVLDKGGLLENSEPPDG